MGEDKNIICKLLLPVLRETSNLSDLENLEYKELSRYEQIVVAKFENGSQKIANVSMDSGTAMIKDIVRQIV